MPDYGNPIRFGTFITPVNRPPQRAVELAQLSESLGYDLVTFQDHPYQPTFHDTWTLLSYVAAKTEKVELAGNVLNLPLRQPAVLARSAASLDLLSGGRVTLGLGAGMFWDAIEAMGGRHLTPGQGVTALREGIEIIRGTWDAGNRAPLRVDGEFYQVAGAARGPMPAHDIPIWIGALKPRMLRLTGELANGWLPSLSYLQPGDLDRMVPAIDEAAARADRDPGEVTRVLNVSPNTPADDLIDLGTRYGFSTFIVGSDDPGTLEHFAREVAPRVRDGIATARASSGVASVHRRRSASALAKRVTGIDYDGIPESLQDRVIEPGDQKFSRYTSTYMRGGSPGLVLRPESVEEVQQAVKVAGQYSDLPLGILSAGHGISGRSINTGGVVIDVGALNSIKVLDPISGRVRIGPGARWHEVAAALNPYDLAISSGDAGNVGVGGIATAGGVGYLARAHGLTIDMLRSVDVVLADGSLVTASATEHPQLFWAMRGAGANFGVAVSFVFEAPKVETIAFAQFVFEADDPAAFLQAWGTAMESADRRVTGEVMLASGQRAASAMIMVDESDPDTVIELLTPFAMVGQLLNQSIGLARYADVMGMSASDAVQQGMGEPVFRSALADHLTPELSAAIGEMLAAGGSPFLQLRAVGGAVSDVAEDATAYAHRSANFSISAVGSRRTRLDELWSKVEEHTQGLYINFETRTGDEVVAQAFPPAHLERLRALKRELDPTGRFSDNFYIAPAA